MVLLFNTDKFCSIIKISHKGFHEGARRIAQIPVLCGCLSYSIREPSIWKGKIVARFSNSSKIQVSCFNLKDTVCYSVDENCVFPSDKFNKYHLIKNMSELSVGMKVFVFNGFEFTQGVVKKIGKYNVDVNYEIKTNKGKTKLITSSFATQILVPNLKE